MPAEDSRTSRPLRTKLAFSAAVVCSAALVLYAALVLARALPIYRHVKHGPRMWDRSIMRSDPALGVAPVPNVTAALHFQAGPPVPTQHDAQGFRVPAGAPPDGPTRMLTLGCSWMYGEACIAEDTFPQRVARDLHMTVTNAAVGGYGLAQMLLRARTLIPERRPDIVLVEYAPWLPKRAGTTTAPAVFGAVPTPYFSMRPGGVPTLQPPQYPSIVFSLPIGAYRTSPETMGDRLSFLRRVGVPLLVHDDAHRLWYGARERLGLTPRPTADTTAVVRAVYGELAELCRTHGARMVVVIIGGDPPLHHLQALQQLPEVDIIDAHAPMLARLHVPTKEAYAIAYFHWRGSPPVLADQHPNPAAHALIAREIVTHLKAK